MNKDLERVIEIPDGVSVVVNGEEIVVKSGAKELKRNFDRGKVEIRVVNGKIVLSVNGATRRESKMIGTIWAHLKNMIKGFSENFVYELEICNVHFPMNVKVDGNRVVIKTFLGETVERIARIMPGVNVDVKGNKISVSSNNIEAAGQTAANIERATKLTGRDRRVFQDGIFITAKPGRKI